MAKKLEKATEEAARAEARALEAYADTDGPYPQGTRVTRPNRPSRMFNVRLTNEQYATLQELARAHHLPMSTMARSWLLERLDHERRAS